LSINKGGNKSCAFAVHADVSPVKVLLRHDSMEGLVELAQVCLYSLSSAQHEPKILKSGGQAPPPPQPLDGSVILLQKSLGSLSESATPVSNNVLTDIRGEGGPPDGRHVSLWMQWTVPSCCLVLETQPTRQRITLAVEDNSLSYDGQATYTKVKLRVRTLHSLVEAAVGEQSDDYEPVPFPSCIVSTKKGFMSRLGAVGLGPGHEEPSGLEDPPEISGQYSAGFSLTLTRYYVCCV
jgi:hypothetical protein